MIIRIGNHSQMASSFIYFLVSELWLSYHNLRTLSLSLHNIYIHMSDMSYMRYNTHMYIHIHISYHLYIYTLYTYITLNGAEQKQRLRSPGESYQQKCVVFPIEIRCLKYGKSPLVRKKHGDLQYITTNDGYNWLMLLFWFNIMCYNHISFIIMCYNHISFPSIFRQPF